MKYMLSAITLLLNSFASNSFAASTDNEANDKVDFLQVRVYDYERKKYLDKMEMNDNVLDLSKVKLNGKQAIIITNPAAYSGSDEPRNVSTTERAKSK